MELLRGKKKHSRGSREMREHKISQFKHENRMRIKLKIQLHV
jgi:hypothetical protein